MGREPSMTQATQVPGVLMGRPESSVLGGVRHLAQAVVGHLEDAYLVGVEPKRFLAARSMR